MGVKRGDATGAEEEQPVAAQRGVPLYQVIAATLRDEIEAQLRPGDSIATEPELEQRFAVSRATVRKAIDLLVHEGRLLRRQGSGTYVTQRRVLEDLGVLYGWSESMRRQGLEPQTVDSELLQVVPPHWVCTALGLNPQAPEPMFRLQRLRYANGEPISLMVDYLRQRFVPELMEEGLVGESLYETLQTRYRLDLARVDDTVTARGASIVEAALLAVPVGSPVLFVTRITFLADEQPLDAATVVSRADHYAYHVVGRTAPRGVPPAPENRGRR